MEIKNKMSKLTLMIYDRDFSTGEISPSVEGFALWVDPNDIFKVGAVFTTGIQRKILSEYRVIFLKYQPEVFYIIKTEDFLEEIKSNTK